MNSIVAGFQAGLARGELLLQHCGHCDQLNMYPRHACPHCQSDQLNWQTAGGSGQLKSFTVLRGGAPEGFADQLPYALGVVLLDEGVQILGRLAATGEGDWSAYSCDCRVRFVPGRSDTYAWFEPANE